jgi:hypothetical protein
MDYPVSWLWSGRSRFSPAHTVRSILLIFCRLLISTIRAISFNDRQEFHFMTDKFHFMTDKFHFMTDKFHLMTEPTALHAMEAAPQTLAE